MAIGRYVSAGAGEKSNASWSWPVRGVIWVVENFGGPDCCKKHVPAGGTVPEYGVNYSGAGR